MKIDYNWKDEPVKKVRTFLGWFRHKPVPMCQSDHYNRESFFPEEKPPTLF